MADPVRPARPRRPSQAERRRLTALRTSARFSRLTGLTVEDYDRQRRHAVSRFLEFLRQDCDGNPYLGLCFLAEMIAAVRHQPGLARASRDDLLTVTMAVLGAMWPLLSAEDWLEQCLVTGRVHDKGGFSGDGGDGCS